MAKSELIGLCDCPECGFPDAEVRNDKSGSPYRFCPDCTGQYFTRGAPDKVKNLLAKVRQAAAPVVASVAPAVQVPEQKTVPDRRVVVRPVPAPAKPERKAFNLDEI